MNCPHPLMPCGTTGSEHAGFLTCGIRMPVITRLLDLPQYGWKIVDGKLECDWDSVENREAVRYQLGLLFRGCSCSSVTACST